MAIPKEQFVSGGPDGTAPTSLSRDVDRLVHKFRTPLNSLSLNADLLGSVSTPKPGKEALHQRALKNLQTEVSRLDRIAGDFQRYVGVGQPSEPKPVPVGELVVAAIEEADAGEVDVRGPESGLEALGDKKLLVSALAELLKNAQEAQGDEPIVLETRAKGDRVEIDVRDTGGGIELDPPDRAFELFFSTLQGHLGFGLTFARRIARAHDGDVSIVETGKEGTTVRLSVPRKR